MLEHRTAQLAALCTFLLLIIGGAVNATGSSLACPEPTIICHGSLMPAMKGGVFYEHGHRLAAMSVGFLQIALTIMLIIRRPGLRALGCVALLMVILQGLLGAITVKYKLPWFVSTSHLLLAISYFAVLIYLVWRTRPLTAAEELRPARIARLGSARRWILVAAGAVFVQLVLGALVRHSEAALACIGMPECTAGGDWFPAALTQRIHMIHRLWGCVVAVITTVAAFQVWRRADGWPTMRRMMLAAPVLVALQVALGIYVVLSFRSVPVAVGHFAGAMSLWALWFGTWLITGARDRAVGVAQLAPVRGVHAVPS
jgi:cytochrome c oxidase assembly protein subunit 15